MNQEKSPDMVRASIGEQVARFERAAAHKRHLEYLGTILLRSLVERLPLEQMLRTAAPKHGINAEDLREFFGKPAGSGDVGCCDAEGHTVQSLLGAWREANEELVRVGRETV